MEIGGKPTQRVYQSRQGHDRFLLLDVETKTVSLYVTVETLLRPSMPVFEEYRQRPYHWADENGMMSVLRLVSVRGYDDAPVSAVALLKEMEAEI